MFVQDYSLQNEAIGSFDKFLCATYRRDVEEIPKDVSPAFHAEKSLKIIST